MRFWDLQVDTFAIAGADSLVACCFFAAPTHTPRSSFENLQISSSQPSGTRRNADRLLGVYLVSERQHRRREEDVLRALQDAGGCSVGDNAWRQYIAVMALLGRLGWLGQ